MFLRISRLQLLLGCRAVHLPPNCFLQLHFENGKSGRGEWASVSFAFRLCVALAAVVLDALFAVSSHVVVVVVVVVVGVIFVGIVVGAAVGVVVGGGSVLILPTAGPSPCTSLQSSFARHQVVRGFCLERFACRATACLFLIEMSSSSCALSLGNRRRR